MSTNPQEIQRYRVEIDYLKSWLDDLEVEINHFKSWLHDLKVETEDLKLIDGVYKGKNYKLKGVYQKAYVVPPEISIGGAPGGQISFPVAVIEQEGKLIEVLISDLEFDWSNND